MEAAQDTLPGELASLPESVQRSIHELRASIDTDVSAKKNPEIVLAMNILKDQVTGKSKDVTRAQVIYSIQQNLNLVEAGALRDQLSKLQGELQTARIGTETIVDAGKTTLSATGNILGAAGTYGLDTFDNGSAATKVGLIGGAILIGGEFIGWIRSFFGEKGKEAGKAIKGWGRTIGGWGLGVAAALGIGGMFGYKMQKNEPAIADSKTEPAKTDVADAGVTDTAEKAEAKKIETDPRKAA